MLSNLNDELIDCSQQSSNETIAEISEDLTLMRSRVDKELEKIETWKAIADQSIKKRDQKIECLISESDELKCKLILVESEKRLLNDKINTERDETIKINIKINTASEAFTRIKSGIIAIEQRFKTFEEINKLIKALNDTRCELFEQLNKNFNDLDIRYQTEITNLMHKINEKENELFFIKEKMTKLINEKEIQLKESNEELTKLKQTILLSTNEKIATINNLNYNLSKANEENVFVENDLNDIINGLNNQLLMKTRECDDFRFEFNELLRNFSDLKLTHEINQTYAEENVIEMITDILIRETDINELYNNCNDLREQNNELSKQLLEQQLNIETIKHKFLNEIETTKNKMKLNFDLFLADKLNIEDNRKLVKRVSEARVTQLENLVTEKNKSIDDLTKNIIELKAQLNTLKLASIEREKNEILRAFYENEKLRSDYESVKKANQLCAENLADTDNEIKSLNKKIATAYGDLEITKQNKKSVEQQLERENHSLDSELSNLRQTIEMCKFDYKQRIEETESSIYNLTKTIENLAKHITLAYRTNKKLETEKTTLSQKLQELNHSIYKTNTQTPITEILEENMRQTESIKCSATLSQTAKSLNHLIVLSETQLIEIVSKIVTQLSDKQNCKKNFGLKRKNCEKDLCDERSEQILLNEKSLKKIKTYENIDRNSAFEIIEDKEIDEKEKYEKCKTSEFVKYLSKHFDRTTTKLNVETNFDARSRYKRTLYNIETVDFDAHFVELKSRAKTRFENILFGRTTNENSDLSWLHL